MASQRADKDEVRFYELNYKNINYVENQLRDLFSRVTLLRDTLFNSVDEKHRNEVWGNRWEYFDVDFEMENVFDTALENAATIRELMLKLLDAASKRNSE